MWLDGAMVNVVACDTDAAGSILDGRMTTDTSMDADYRHTIEKAASRVLLALISYWKIGNGLVFK
jgi:hypothetical protein